MTYNKRKNMHIETARQGARSPSVKFSSPYNRTPSYRERTSSLAQPSLQGRSEARGSPAPHPYGPPPPISDPAGRSSPGPNLNNAIPCSPSPLAEARYACTGVPCRPSSAATPHPRGETAPPKVCSPLQRAASTVMAPPRPRAAYYDDCGVIVEERDPLTRDVIARYRCGSLLGTGGFAQVFDFKDLATGVRYAGKVIDKRTLMRRGSEAKFRMEVDIHSRVKHPNIVQFVKTFQDEYYHYIILEQCSRKSLMDLSKERGVFTCEEMRHIMTQIVSAVEYMHGNRIIHRDLKLGNIMIDFSGNMKVGDFGFASELISATDKKMTTCGTPNYIAPEVLATGKTGLGYGLEADIWSLGVVLYALAFGTPPFETKDINTTYNKIRRVDYSFPPGTSVPESCKDLIQRMLQKDPQQRPSPAKILQHSFLHIPQPLHLSPSSLVPPEALLSTSPHERSSPLWASPVAIRSPFAYYHKGPNNYQKSAARKHEDKKENDHEFRMTLHEFLKKNDCISETTSGALHSCSGDALAQPKPPPPTVMLQSSIYCNKYGHGFLLYQNGKQYPTVFLNDKTKLAHDISSDTVYYYERSRMPRMSSETGNRSPLLSEELAAKGFRDELVVFRGASTLLAHRNEKDEAATRVEAAAAKKLAITRFFLPFLERGVRDKRVVSMTCALKGWHSVWEKELFAPSRSGDERADIVYVKDAVMGSLHELTGEYQDVDMQLLVTRMSDYSFQVSARCYGEGYALFCPKCDLLEVPGTDLPWCFDILIYAGFHAVMALEMKDFCLVFSFWDIRHDFKGVGNGRLYMAAGSTTQIRSIMIPAAMLRTVAALLRRARCSTDIVDCFC